MTNFEVLLEFRRLIIYNLLKAGVRSSSSEAEDAEAELLGYSKAERKKKPKKKSLKKAPPKKSTKAAPKS